MSARGTSVPDWAEEDFSPLDLVLKQGTEEQRAAMRRRVAEDPMLAIEVAETVGLLEQFRLATVEPSGAYAAKLHAVVRRSELRLERRRPTPLWPKVLWVAAVAGITFTVLGWSDPMGLRQVGARGVVASGESPMQPRDPVGSGGDRGQAVTLPADRRDFLAVAAEMRQRLEQLEAPAEMRAEFQAALATPQDELGRWLDPQNALASMRIVAEQRFSERQAGNRQFGERGLGMEVRAQQLADSVATELAQRFAAAGSAGTSDAGGERRDLEAIAMAVRACVAVGSAEASRSNALAMGADWLQARMPATSGPSLVNGLCALVEVAATRGSYDAVVVREGQRFLDEVLLVDDETWGRRLPEILGSRVPTATLADAGRMLAFLPGFGLQPDRCALVRRLILGELRERLGHERGPEALAGLVYGFSDLLGAGELEALAADLRRWKPARLAPDFSTVRQIAWGIESGNIGYTALQAGLRRLTVLPDPDALVDRAALCMCLARSSTPMAALQTHRLPLGD